MSYIRRLTPPPAPPNEALRQLHATRRAMNIALVNWCRSRPDPDDVALEVEGTVGAIRQLASLTVVPR